MKNEWIVSICVFLLVGCYDLSLKPRPNDGGNELIEGGASQSEGILSPNDGGSSANFDGGGSNYDGSRSNYYDGGGVLVCGPGLLVCDNACVPNDKRNCGRCDHDCTALKNVSDDVNCDTSAGICVVPASSCKPGWAHCSTVADDGCETAISTVTNCGGCNVACSNPALPLCAPKDPAGTPKDGYECSSTCPTSAPTICESSCVNTDTSPRHCGKCGQACPVPDRGSATCTGGICTITCNPDSHLCNDKCVSNSSTDSCGTSCEPCDVPLDSIPSCDGTKCSFTCKDGFLLCDGKCVPNDKNNCGTCEHDCSALPNVSGDVSCIAGVCTVPSSSCAPGYGHCSTNPDDGCETDLSKPATCGSCTTTCPKSTPLCSLKSGSSAATPMYECVSGCASTAPTLCGTSCVNTTNNPSHCGQCDYTCPKPSGNGQALCENSQCTIKCSDNYHSCGNACVYNKSTDTCGNRCDPCVDPPYANATCDGTTCGFSCMSNNYVACDIDTGCVLNDNKNCGICGNNCTAQKQVCDGAGKCVGCLKDSDCSGSTPVCVDQVCRACNPNGTNTCTQPSSDCQEIVCTSSATCSSPTYITDGTICSTNNGKVCLKGTCVECRNGSDCSTNHCAQNHCTECDSNGGCETRTCRESRCSSAGVCSYPLVATGTSCNSTGGTCNANGSCVNEPYPECSVSGQECPFSSTRRGICTSFGYCTIACNSKSDCPQVTNATVTCSYMCGMSCSGGSCPIGMLCSSSGECYWKMLD